MSRQNSPQALLVMLEFAATASKNEELRFFAEYLFKGHTPVAPQLFFMDLHTPGTTLMQRAALEPLQEFLAWGFLARERPIIHGDTRLTLGHWGSTARQNIIRRLLKNNHTLTLSNYLTALDHTVSRQQALADMKESPLLKMKGKGRGAVWVKLANIRP